MPGDATIVLGEEGNAIAGTASFTTTAGDVTFVNSAGVTLAVSNIAGNLSVNAGGTVTLSGNIAANAASIDTATGSIFQGDNTKSIQAGTVSLTSGGNIGGTGAPVIIGGGSGAVSLSLDSGGNNATIQSLTGVSIDNPGVNTGGGDFTLSAAGPITQTWGITAGNLNVTTTGSGNAITLTDAGNYMTGDPGNVIASAATFNTTGTGADVSYTNADSQTSYTYIDSSNVGGNLTVTAVYTNIQLGESGSISVGGSTTLNANERNGQGIPLTTNGLTATAGGSIDLTNENNQISGTSPSRLSATAAATFA